jgi:hypothetical protein
MVLMANRRKKCKRCGEYHDAESGVQLPAGFFCSKEHAIEHGLEASRKRAERLRAKAVRAQSVEAKNAAKRDRERRMEVKPLSYWMKRAQAAVNRYVRVRDRDLPCISCGRHHTGQYHAGHYRSVAACSSMRFYTLNINKQCSVCNTHLSSNAIQYRLALVEKYGANTVEYIESSNGCARYSVDYLKRIELVFKAKTKAIEKRFANG